MAPIVVDDDVSNIVGIVIIGCMLLVMTGAFTYIGVLVTRRFFRPASARASPSFGERVRRLFSKLRPVRRRRQQASNDVEGAADAGPPHELSGENLPEYHVADPRPPILPPLYGSWSQALPQTHSVPPCPDGRGQRAPRPLHGPQQPLHGPQQPAVVHPGDRWDLGAGDLGWWHN